jgi:hypothetical protein
LGERPALRREREGFFRDLVVGDPLLQSPVVNVPAGVRCPRQLQPGDGARVEAVFNFSLTVHRVNKDGVWVLEIGKNYKPRNTAFTVCIQYQAGAD